MSNFIVISASRINQSFTKYNKPPLVSKKDLKDDNGGMLAMHADKLFPIWEIEIAGTLENSRAGRDEGSYYGNTAVIRYFSQSGKIIKTEPVTEELWYNMIMPAIIEERDTAFLPQEYDPKLAGKGVGYYSKDDYIKGLGIITVCSKGTKDAHAKGQDLAESKPYILAEGYDPAKEKLKGLVENKKGVGEVEVTTKDNNMNAEENKRNSMSKDERQRVQQNEQAKSKEFASSPIFG